MNNPLENKKKLKTRDVYDWIITYRDTSNPTANDDFTKGFTVGSNWVNKTTGACYVCVDVSEGAAVWKGETSESINFADLADVSLTSPKKGDNLYISADGDIENARTGMMGIGTPMCLNTALTWDVINASGEMNFAVTRVWNDSFVGNGTISYLNGITPTSGDSYVVTDTGTLTSGSLDVTPGDIVWFDTTEWKLIQGGLNDFVQPCLRLKLSTTTALIAPYTDGTDDGKIIYFNGTSNTGTETTLNVEVILPNIADLPFNDGLMRTFHLGLYGAKDEAHEGTPGKLTVKPYGSELFIDGLSQIDLCCMGSSMELGATNGLLSNEWLRISKEENNFKVARNATWASSNFSSPTAIPFDTLVDEGNSAVNSWAVTPNPTRIVCGVSGKFKPSGYINIDSTGGSTWNAQTYLLKNGTDIIPLTDPRTGNFGSEDGTVPLVFTPIELKKGDYLEWIIDQNLLTGYLLKAALMINRIY